MFWWRLHSIVASSWNNFCCHCSAKHNISKSSNNNGSHVLRLPIMQYCTLMADVILPFHDVLVAPPKWSGEYFETNVCCHCQDKFSVIKFPALYHNKFQIAAEKKLVTQVFELLRNKPYHANTKGSQIGPHGNSSNVTFENLQSSGKYLIHCFFRQCCDTKQGLGQVRMVDQHRSKLPTRSLTSPRNKRDDLKPLSHCGKLNKDQNMSKFYLQKCSYVGLTNENNGHQGSHKNHNWLSKISLSRWYLEIYIKKKPSNCFKN